jgi:hypothetical protein
MYFRMRFIRFCSNFVGCCYMVHKTGFTYATLNNAFLDAGFKFNIGAAQPSNYNLWIVSFKQLMSNEEGTKIAMNYLPCFPQASSGCCVGRRN